MASFFRVKICGITTPEDAQATVDARADAVGLNFYQRSPRFLKPENGEAVVRVLPDDIVRVGLFVNASATQVQETYEQLRLDLVQLHGDEPPEFLRELGGLPVMRAFRLGEAGLAPVLEYLTMCRELSCLPELVLIDSFRKGHYGGTGATADWATAREYPSEGWHPPLVLAGGLTAENVAEAIRVVSPVAVDTASGVESSPGRKDPEMVAHFVEAAMAAFDETR